MIRSLIDLYILLLIADVVLSYLPQYRNAQAVVFVRKAADFTCKPVRRLLPQDLPFDFSPMVVIIGLNLLKALW